MQHKLGATERYLSENEEQIAKIYNHRNNNTPFHSTAMDRKKNSELLGFFVDHYGIQQNLQDPKFQAILQQNVREVLKRYSQAKEGKEILDQQLLLMHDGLDNAYHGKLEK